MAFVAAAVGAVGVGASIYSAKQQSDAISDAAGAAGNVQLPSYNLFTPGGGIAGQGTRDLNANAQGFAGFDALAQGTQGSGGVAGTALPPQGQSGPSATSQLDPFNAEINQYLADKALFDQQQAELPPWDRAEFNPANKQHQNYSKPGGGSYSPEVIKALTQNKRATLESFAANNQQLAQATGGAIGPDGRLYDSESQYAQSQGQLGGLDLTNEFNNSLGYTLGDLEGARGGLAELANINVGKAGQLAQGGLPQGVQNAAAFAQQANTAPLDQQLEGLGLVENLAGQALSGNNALFQSRLNEGFQTGEQARAAALDNFRAQALPENQRQVNSTLSNLFGGGRLGTTGGANVVGRLAEAQNQQDLQFQQAANNEGRAVQSNAENLLSGAFNRFNQTEQLAGDLNQNRFVRGAAAQDAARAGANTSLQQNMGLESFLQQLQGGQLGLAGQALTSESGIQQQGINRLNTNLAYNTADANAQIGAGSNVAALAQNPNYGASPFTGLGESLVQNSQQIGSTISSGLNSIFGSKPASPASSSSVTV